MKRYPPQNAHDRVYSARPSSDMQTIGANTEVISTAARQRQALRPNAGVILHVLVPVMVGATIYLSWRSPTLLVFQWVRSWNLSSTVAAWRHTLAPLQGSIPRWVLFSLPDALWVYALTACMTMVWMRRQTEWAARLWIASGAFLGCSAEIVQWSGAIPGTYDSVDLLLSAAAALLARWAVIGRLNATTSG